MHIAKSSHDQGRSGYRFDLYCISMATACHCKRGGALSSLCQYCSAGVAKFHFSGGFYNQALLNTSTSTQQPDILRKEKKPNNYTITIQWALLNAITSTFHKPCKTKVQVTNCVEQSSRVNGCGQAVRFFALPMTCTSQIAQWFAQ